MTTNPDRGEPPAGRGGIRPYLLLSAACLVAQTALTDYGSGGRGVAVFWLVVGLLLLWLVDRRRSRVARGVVVVSGLLGALLYLVAAFSTPNALLLAGLFLGQALPLLGRPVRAHVATRPVRDGSPAGRADLTVKPSPPRRQPVRQDGHAVEGRR